MFEYRTNQFQEALPRQKVSQDDNRGQLVTRTIDMEMVDPYHRPYVCFRFLYRTQGRSTLLEYARKMKKVLGSEKMVY